MAFLSLEDVVAILQRHFSLEDVVAIHQRHGREEVGKPSRLPLFIFAAVSLVGVLLLLDD